MIRNHRKVILLKQTYLTNQIFSLKTPVTKIRIPPEIEFKFVHVHVQIHVRTYYNCLNTENKKIYLFNMTSGNQIQVLVQPLVIDKRTHVKLIFLRN